LKARIEGEGAPVFVEKRLDFVHLRWSSRRDDADG
jgi:hypothetical protein